MSKLKRPIVWPEVDSSGEPRDGTFISDTWPTLYTDLRDMRMTEWTKRATEYEADPDDFLTCWYWLHFHPVFWYFGTRPHESNLVWDRGVDEGLEFRPAMVDPKTRRIEKRKSRNTHLDIWVEVFPASMRQMGGGIRLHDVDCDTGGVTYEEAFIKVAKEIYDKHGHDRQVLAEKWGQG